MIIQIYDLSIDVQSRTMIVMEKGNSTLDDQNKQLHTSLEQWLIKSAEHRIICFSYHDLNDNSVYLYNGIKF